MDARQDPRVTRSASGLALALPLTRGMSLHLVALDATFSTVKLERLACLGPAEL